MTRARPMAVGIDIGGTCAKSVVIDEAGAVLQEDERDSVEGADAFVRLVRSVLDTFGAASTVPLGIACPGLARLDHRAIACMPGRMEGLEGLVFSEAMDRSAFVLNDAHAATVGEAAYGAAAGYEHVVMLTLGTGVGGGVIINGRLYTGATGRAGHFGHLTIDVSGTQDICRMPGSIEDAIGNHSVSKRSNGRFTSTHELVIAVESGDTVALEIWQASIDRLAVALASLVNAFDPEAIVLGGGVIAAGASLFEPLAIAMQRVEWRPMGAAVPIMPATLGTKAGAIGAARFAQQSESRA